VIRYEGRVESRNDGKNALDHGGPTGQGMGGKIALTPMGVFRAPPRLLHRHVVGRAAVGGPIGLLKERAIDRDPDAVGGPLTLKLQRRSSTNVKPKGSRARTNHYEARCGSMTSRLGLLWRGPLTHPGGARRNSAMRT